MARNHLHLGLALLTVSVLLVTLAVAAPKDPQRKIKHDIRSLRGLNTVKLKVTHFSKALESLLPSDAVLQLWRKQLVRAGFTVVDTGDVPTLGLKAMLVESDNAPKHYGYTMVLTLEQPVHVRRTDEELYLPTFSEMLAGIELRDRIEIDMNKAAKHFVDRFIKLVASAARTGE